MHALADTGSEIILLLCGDREDSSAWAAPAFLSWGGSVGATEEHGGFLQ